MNIFSFKYYFSVALKQKCLQRTALFVLMREHRYVHYANVKGIL